mgnify:CR=1 FL=1
MNKTNTLESVTPLSGQYSFKKDVKLNAWLGVAAVTYVAAKIILKDHPDWDPWMKAMISLSPLLPGCFYARSCMKFIRGLDEFQRRIQLQVLLFAAMGTLIVGWFISALNANGIDLKKFTHGLEMSGAFVVLFGFWVVGTFIANRRYK